MKYARFVNDIAVEFFTPPEGFSIEQCFHPDLVKQFELVDDDFQLGSIKLVEKVVESVAEVVEPVAEIAPAETPLENVPEA